MSDIEHVRCEVIRETGKAYKLKDSENPERVDWFPKSQVSFAMRNMNTGVATAEIPLWLLEEKGWDA